MKTLKRIAIGFGIIYFGIAAYGILYGWYDCSQQGGEWVRNILGFWRCVYF